MHGNVAALLPATPSFALCQSVPQVHCCLKRCRRVFAQPCLGPHGRVWGAEVIMQEYGPVADEWSVGMLMYQLLTGVFPFWDSVQNVSLQQVLPC